MRVETETEINQIASIMLLAHGFHQQSDKGFGHSDGRSLHLPDGHITNQVMQNIASEVRKLVEGSVDVSASGLHAEAEKLQRNAHQDARYAPGGPLDPGKFIPVEDVEKAALECGRKKQTMWLVRTCRLPESHTQPCDFKSDSEYFQECGNQTNSGNIGLQTCHRRIHHVHSCEFE